MKRIFDRIASFVFAILFASTILISSAAAAGETENTLIPISQTTVCPFNDTKELWGEESVNICYQAGILAGVTDTLFLPYSGLTNAQIIVIAARLLDKLSGGSGILESPSNAEHWYASAYQYLQDAASNAGITLSWSLANEPDKICYRRTFVKVLATVLTLSKTELPKLNSVSVLLDSYDPAIISFYQAGILNGSDPYGCFQGLEDLNRGQAAAILARIIDPSLRLTFELPSVDLCRDIFQLDPDMVLYSLGDTDYTVLQAAPYICGIWGLDDYKAINVEEFFHYLSLSLSREQIAPRVLAQQCGIELSAEEQQEIYDSAQLKNGYMGLPTKYWAGVDSTDKIMEHLRDYYSERFGTNQYGQTPELSLDLGELGQYYGTQLTAKFDPSSIDLLGIKNRLEEMPYCPFIFL